MSRPYRLGLTGSIGMGKSTTARLFAEAGVPVWDADAAVHRLYAPGGAAVAAVAELVPEVIVGGGVDRDRLRMAIAEDHGLLTRVEALVHPLVTDDRAAFSKRYAKADVVVFDIPLLYESGAERGLDAVLVVTAPAEVQRERVLARPTMTPDLLEQVLARQLPDSDKRARADFVIDTGRGLDAARVDVLSLLGRIRSARSDA